MAIAGVLHPIVAAAAMTFSSLSGQSPIPCARGYPHDHLYLLIFLTVCIGFAGWLIFLWAVKSGQFDDVEGPKYRMLDDD